MTEAEQSRQLRRFARQIRRASRQAVTAFEPSVEYADASQEASILVITYAGLMPGRLQGKLTEWERMAKGSESRVRGLLGAQLRLDLLQIFGRLTEHQETFTSLENLPARAAPQDSPEDRWITRVDRDCYVRDNYPYSYKHAVDAMTLDQVAKFFGEDCRTVDRRIADEKRKAAADPYFARC